MNQGMREGDSALLERYDPHIRTITSGLDQLPAYEGVVGRGITINDPAVLQNLEGYAKPSLKKCRPIAARNEDKKVFSGRL